MKKIVMVLAIGITILSLNKNSGVTIPKNSIRFRIIANSNSNEDQSIKRKVVNNLKNTIGRLNYESKSLEQSRENIQKSLPIFEEIVNKTLSDVNPNQSYSIHYGKNYFPQKEYKGVVYDEGEYESLVITLGNGIGDNFWCILFPPLCLLEAEEQETENIEYTSLIKEIIDKYF